MIHYHHNISRFRAFDLHVKFSDSEQLRATLQAHGKEIGDRDSEIFEAKQILHRLEERQKEEKKRFADALSMYREMQKIMDDAS